MFDFPARRTSAACTGRSTLAFATKVGSPPFVTIVARRPDRPFKAHSDPDQPEGGSTPNEPELQNALAESRSAVDIICKQKLSVIAMELHQTVRRNFKVDWWRREDLRSRMPEAVKTIL